MNKRARKARRILREHRRDLYCRSHRSWDYSRPWGGMSSSWRCPRCPKVVSGQWRLEQHAVTNYFEQASAVRAMEFTPEMAAEFLRTEAKREEEVRE